MDQNNTTTPTSTPAATPVAPAPPVSPAPASGAVVSSPKKPGMGKKPVIIVLVLVIFLVVLGAAGYYYYANMMSKPEQAKAFPTLAPVVSVAPTQDPEAIQDENDLDDVVNGLDSASDEADMTTESKSLQTDSNF